MIHKIKNNFNKRRHIWRLFKLIYFIITFLLYYSVIMLLLWKYLDPLSIYYFPRALTNLVITAIITIADYKIAKNNYYFIYISFYFKIILIFLLQKYILTYITTIFWLLKHYLFKSL